MCDPWEDLPRDRFVKAIAENFVLFWGGSIEDYLAMAESALTFVLGKQEFDGADYDWCLQAAKEWAEEEASYT